MEADTYQALDRLMRQRKANGFILTKVKVSQGESKWFETNEEIPEEFCIKFRLRRDDNQTIAYGFHSPKHPLENALKQEGAFRCCTYMQIHREGKWVTVKTINK